MNLYTYEIFIYMNFLIKVISHIYHLLKILLMFILLIQLFVKIFQRQGSLTRLYIQVETLWSNNLSNSALILHSE